MCSTLMVVSCSDDKDKDDKKIQKEMLIGKWVLTHYEYEDSTGDKDVDDYLISEEEDVIEFRKDGICHNYCAPFEDGGYDWNNYGEWNLQETSLTLFFQSQENKTVKLIQLTSDILIFEYEDQSIDYDTGEIVICYEFYTYQKVD